MRSRTARCKELSTTTMKTRQVSLRSMYGGLVFWDKGILSDGSDSIAVRFLHWAHGIASNRGRKLLALLAREHLCRVPVRESGGQYGRNEPLRGNESEHGDP